MVAPSRETLLALQGDTGFAAGQLEAVLRLSDLLDAIGQHPQLEDRLLLTGGTALNLCFGPPPRLSVDLDFNYVGQIDRAAMERERPDIEAAIEQVARRAGYQVQRSAREHGGRTFFLRYRSAFGNDASVRVDVNFLHRIPLIAAPQEHYARTWVRRSDA